MVSHIPVKSRMAVNYVRYANCTTINNDANKRKMDSAAYQNLTITISQTLTMWRTTIRMCGRTARYRCWTRSSRSSSGCLIAPWERHQAVASSNERVWEMAYKRGSGCQSCVILLQGSRDGNDIPVSEVCKSSTVEIASKTNLSSETQALLYL